jgi:tetratricopeptide (TPR) repeat protein
VAVDRDKVLQAAQKLVEKKRYDKAIAEYQKLVSDDPKDVRTLLKIGDLYLKMEQFADAIVTYERVGQFYSTQGFHLKAIAVFKQIREIVHKHVPHLEDHFGHIVPKLAETYAQLGLTSDALAAYDEVATRYQRSGRDHEAIDAYWKIVDLDPQNPLPHVRLAELLVSVGSIDRAIERFGAAAEILLKLERREDALKIIERLLQHRADAKHARTAAEIYLNRGEPTDGLAALSRLQICFKEDPQDLDTLALLARALDRLGEAPKSIEVQKEAARIARERGKVDHFDALVRALLIRAPHDEGVRRLATLHTPPPPRDPVPSITTEPGVRVTELDARARKVLAQVDLLRRSKSYDEAVALLLESVDELPASRELRERLCDVLIEVGDQAEAVRQMLSFARWLAQSNDVDYAASILDEVLLLEPGQPDALAMLRELGYLLPEEFVAPDVEDSEINPGLPELDSELLDAFKDPIDADNPVNVAATSNQSDARVSTILAQVDAYSRAKRYEAAVDRLYDGIDELPSSGELRERLWGLLIELDDKPEASLQMLAHARQLARVGNIADERRVLEELLTLEPGQQDALTMLRALNNRTLATPIQAKDASVQRKALSGPDSPQASLEVGAGPASLEVFISYAPKDRELLTELEKHLALMIRQGAIRVWHQGLAGAGEGILDTTVMRLNHARVVLLLISSEYFADESCYELEVRAMRLGGGVRIVPLILRPCDWERAQFGKLPVLPKNRRAVTSWSDPNDAWVDIVFGLNTILDHARASSVKHRSSHEVAGAPDFEPHYDNMISRELAKKIDALCARRSRLREVGHRADDVEREILELRRQMREGGQLHAGDALSDERYLLLRTIGKGGFAFVWEALDRESNQLVAIKVLHPAEARDPSKRERFFRGARVMGSLRHEAIVRVLEPRREDAGYFFFVMELVPGLDLHRTVVSRKLPRERAIPVVLRTGEALALAHAKGITHRDVKPANVLLDDAGAPKLTDFDLVGMKETTGGTRTGAMGTFLFTAPEQIQNAKKADPRADVYGLGMIAIFCLHGGELPPIMVRRPDKVIQKLPCTDAVKHVLESAIELDPEERFEDARVFCNALRAAADTNSLL